MPALPKINRRRGVTPVKKLNQDDVWERAMKIMGLEPLSATSNYNNSTTLASKASSPIHLRTKELPRDATKMKLTILDLPSETQKEIFKHASSTDLIALSLVSKHFRELAAEQIYRSFHIVFPDDDDAGNDSPIDVLAAGLETFVSSEYDYSQHIREIILEPLSGGEKGERAYRYYLYDSSCGKFMNTLFLLMLRKAKSLETFKWDIRVELSRPMFKALHQIEALQHLHLRMQAGHSTYQAPPAISNSGTAQIINHPLAVSLPPPPPPGFGPPHSHPIPSHYASNSSNSFAVGNKYASKSHSKTTKALLPALKKSPPTLSGFKNLKTLEILDMDTLDYVGELRPCIRNSSSTLTTLKMSFSEVLANKSRKPPPEIHSDDDSEQEDEFGQVIPLGPPPGAMASSSSGDGQSKIVKAQEEKKKQEEVLQRIFGTETQATRRSKPLSPISKTETTEVKLKGDEDPKQRFIRNLAPVAHKLMSYVNPGSELTAEANTVLEMISQASQKYLYGSSSQNKSTGSNSKPTPATSTSDADGIVEDEPLMSGGAPEEPGLFDEPTKQKKASDIDPGVSNPDDIDIEEPEPDELVEIDSVADENEVNQETEEQSETPAESTEDDLLIKKSININTELDVLNEKMKSTDICNQALANTDNEITNLEQQVVEARRAKLNSHGEVKPHSQEGVKMNEYVRSTRGLNLTTLAIYLIPIKANIISRGVDLNVLENITLLNVGPQNPFWNLLAKENTILPLRLSKIYTDNVTLPFLSFVSQLDNVTELLLLEKQKSRVESTAAKTVVNIEHIRKALKKHISSLKVLMIRHDSSPDWDLNVKTSMMLCQRATKLEELSVTFGPKVVHTLLQFIHGMTSLRALHTNYFRQEDNCQWVRNNFGKFLVDAVSHNPKSKLEYVGLDQNVERLVRRSRAQPSKKASDRKGKGKATPAENAKALAEMVLGPNGTWPDGGVINSSGSVPSFDWHASSDEEDEPGPVIGKLGLKVETIEGVRFSDVTGVRIFEKDVVSGRL